MTRITDSVAHYKTAVALGFFDGLHAGHKALLGRIIGREGLHSLVFTFGKGTLLPKFNDGYGGLIQPYEEKEQMLDDMGIDHIYAPDFAEIKDYSAEGFVCDVIKKRLNAKYAVCGYDFRFGQEAKGSSQLFAVLCRKNGIECDVVPEVKIDGETVSSTHIRNLIGSGAVAAAARFLGRELSYTLPVYEGKKLGRTIGFPTINQYIPADRIKPANGVYGSRVEIDGKIYNGITNIGVKPTVKDDDRVVTETHIVDFSGDLYNRDITLYLSFFIRREKKYESLDALKEQIKQDFEYAAAHR